MRPKLSSSNTIPYKARMNVETRPVISYECRCNNAQQHQQHTTYTENEEHTSEKYPTNLQYDV